MFKFTVITGKGIIGNLFEQGGVKVVVVYNMLGELFDLQAFDKDDNQIEIKKEDFN